MKKAMILGLLLLSVSALKAQIMTPVKWAYGAKKGPAGTLTVFFKATIDDGWHIYSVNQKPGGPQKTVFKFTKSPDYLVLGKPVEPRPDSKFEEAFGIKVFYFSKAVTFQQKLKLKKGETTVRGTLTYMACTDKQCLAPEELAFEIPVK
ncbi:protein-disulfide reductase DsbD domain-containing protein [Mucilaginibacter sp. UR6-11]|uniref:protein-disulfide reductase DsbD domain-containing protein n=1 Tax=Mucilaginibacter sp. UR6-11 TaxID=1435644 RepID=UPI001E5130A4|nr:protein-disulfide reductase DsbD domain-containing protein [Mucilaginibacter sp. UR6-11]MCC8423607.1 protein-disulfide reductase DsbD N-terminal domain-containing protein [Mucilaginibacter sp. UR6-11]